MSYVLCPRGTWWCWGSIDIGLAGEATHGIILEEEQLNSVYEEVEHENSALHIKGMCRTGNPGRGHGYCTVRI